MPEAVVYVIQREKYRVDIDKFLKIYKDDLEAEFGDDTDTLELSDIEWFISETIANYGHEIHGVEPTDQVDTEFEVEVRR